MGKRFDCLAFPGGKQKAFTMSFDDGVVQDKRLIQLIDKYGIKATFNLGYEVLGFHGKAWVNERMVDVSKVGKEEIKDLYKNHEIAGHGLFHSSLTSLSSGQAMYEIVEDKYQLEKASGKILRSFAYPFGHTNAQVQKLLELAGYTNARGVQSTYRFDLPENFLNWSPTCHFYEEKTLPLIREFTQSTFSFTPQIFFMWGHAYEIDAYDAWTHVESICNDLSKYSDQIWYATVGDITEYIKSYRRLEFSTDGLIVHNPSAQTIWLRIPASGMYQIEGGQTLSIKDPPL